MAEVLVQPYDRLRERMAARDRSLRDKVMSLSEAAALVQDGMLVGIGGSTMSRTPMAMIWELIRQRRKKLTCARCIVSTDGDLVFGSGIADRVITSWFAQGILWGLSKVLRHHVEKGDKIFEEWSHMGVGMRFRAGAMGVPFMPMRSMLGSDILPLHSEAKTMDCPYTGEQLLLAPALNPHVALIHVQRCDPYGNAQIDGLQFMDIDLAQAADSVIITTEQIVSNEQIRRAPHHTKIPFMAVDAVVEVPYGAAPHECYGIYEPMMKHLNAYVKQVNADPVGGMESYLQKYIYEPEGWEDFLNLVGLHEILESSKLGRSIYND